MPRFDFAVPANPLELEKNPSGGWTVQTSRPEDLPGELEDVAARLEDDPLLLAEPANFDPLYSAVRHFGALGTEARDRTQEVIGEALKGATLVCKRTINAMGGSDDELAERRQLLRLAAFLQSWLVREAEKLAAEALPNAALAAAAKPKKGGKKGAAVAEKGWSWAEQRESAMVLLLNALELDLGVLWERRAPEDGFSLLFSRAAFAVLEQPAAAKALSGALKDVLWRLVALPVEHYGQADATASTLVELLLGYEHLATPLAELVQKLLEEHDGVQPALALLRQLADLARADLGADAAGPKNLAAFLTALAAKAPLLLLANSELLRVHLESESYALRCGAVSACAQLAVQATQLDAGAKAEVAEAAEAMLQVPIARLLDISSFVRCRALGALLQLLEARALPHAAFTEVAAAGLERLDDKNANVRRAALQLFRGLLEFNPFCPTLSRPQLEARRALLRANMPAPTPMKGAKPTPEEAAEGEESAAAPAEAAEGEAEGEEAAAPPTPAPAPPAVPLDPTAAALQLAELALELEGALQARLPTVAALLGSQTTSDVLEALRATVAAHAFELHGARPAAMLLLVWSREPAVKQACLEASQAVWLRSAPAARGEDRAVAAARGLLLLVEGSTLAERTSLEAVVAEWHVQGLLPSALLSTLWDCLQGRRPELREAWQRRGALALLNMAGGTDAALLRRKMDVLISQLTTGDLKMARHAAAALRRCAAAGAVPPSAARPLVHALEELVLRPPAAAQAEAWFGAAEEAVATLYAACPAPVEVGSELARQLAARALPSLFAASGAPAENATADAAGEANATVDSGALARLLFLLGKLALQTLVAIEAREKALARTRAALADAEDAKAAAAEAAPPAAGKRGKKGKDSEAEAGTGAPEESAEDQLARELGTNAAAAEAEGEELLLLGEKLLQPSALLGSFVPVVVAVATNRDGAFGAPLRAAAALTLCQFMCVSAPLCEAQLPLLFTLLQREPEREIRANIVVALGDVAVRHPNLLEPWTSHVYAQLRDADLRVRKNTLLVLTHLILNDMVKVKGQVAEMALCLVDAEQRVAALARLFFTEFAKKGSAPVYNLLPDIMSSLSANRAVTPEAFREVMAFLIGFISKDKQTEAMTEKLCLRFSTSDEVQHHRDVAFCVGTLQHTERSVKKLHELFKTFADKLGDAEVRESFASLVRGARKFAKAELKTALDDLEALLGGAEAALANGDELPLTAESAAAAAATAKPAAAAPKAAAGRRKKSAPPKKSKKAEWEEGSDEEEGADEDEEGGENTAPADNKPEAAPTKTSRARKAKPGPEASEPAPATRVRPSRKARA